MHKPQNDFLRSNTGFSLIELCITVALIMVISGFAILGVNSVQSNVLADNAMYQIVDQLRKGRESAISHRRAVEVQFLNSDTVQLVRREIPNGETILSTVQLTNNYRFLLLGGVPDSPDLFGNESALDFGGETTLLFLSDGILADDQGNPLNGSVFLGREGRSETARAVTILGTTGRIRSYRWTGSGWIQ